MKLVEMMRSAVEGCDKNKMNVLTRFSPLIWKYSNELGYDGAESDLIIALLESLPKIVKSLSNEADDNLVLYYLKRRMIYKKIDLYRRNSQRKLEFTSDLHLELIPSESCIENDMTFEDLIGPLNERMRVILRMRYKDMLTDIEISKQLKTSRQYVCQTRTRALKLLRDFISED